MWKKSKSIEIQFFYDRFVWMLSKQFLKNFIWIKQIKFDEI